MLSNGPRTRLWQNILEDLGPPEACVLPGWLILVHCLLFPLQGLRYFVDRDAPYDPMRYCWRINGVRFSARSLLRLSRSPGGIYRVTRRDDIVVIEPIANLQDFSDVY